jgi:hypothetical protein
VDDNANTLNLLSQPAPHPGPLGGGRP